MKDQSDRANPAHLLLIVIAALVISLAAVAIACADPPDEEPDRAKLDRLLAMIEANGPRLREIATRPRLHVGLAGTNRVSVSYTPADDDKAAELAGIVEALLPADFTDKIKLTVREKNEQPDASLTVYGGELMHELRITGPRGLLAQATVDATRVMLSRLDGRTIPE